MTVLIVQFNKAMGAFKTTSRRDLSQSDVTRTEALAKSTNALEQGYFDVLLVPGVITAVKFSAWAQNGVPPWMLAAARDAIILIK